MTYPKIVINLSALEYNIHYLVDFFKKKNIEIAFVTKSFCADEKITSTVSKCKVRWLADSRVQNLEKLSEFPQEKMLLRLPMQSEIADVIKYSDFSLNSSVETVRMLSDEAKRQGKVHKIILMLDMGDLREGIFEEDEMFFAAEEILKMEGVILAGVGTNLTCYGAVIPSEENLGRLVEIRNRMEARFHISLPIVSGGNSSSMDLLSRVEIPGISQLRIGEVALLGKEPAYGKRISDLRDDVFELYAEIIEIFEKPSVPIGEIGVDAFGNHEEYVDYGRRKRAIIALGRQDVQFRYLEPKDQSLRFIGGSSDHTIIDVTDAEKEYHVGDVLNFKLCYASILGLMTSPYVYREYVTD